MRLLPREEKFFELFQAQADIICKAADLLAEGVKAQPGRMAEAAAQITNLEHRGDEVIHEVFQRLNQTFLTPLEPEDIHAISSSLDDVLDAIEETAHRLVAYKIEAAPEPVATLAGIIQACSKSMQSAFDELPRSRKILDYCIEINRLENVADIQVRSAVEDLFNSQIDPILLIKLKEIYDSLEDAADRCEDVADVLQNVVVKNS
jgi:hypothetical protein